MMAGHDRMISFLSKQTLQAQRRPDVEDQDFRFQTIEQTWGVV